jgi:hypothetical protein
MVKGIKIMIEDIELGIRYGRDVPVDNENYPKYKAAINRNEQNTIKRCCEIEYDTFQTAHYMKITESCVKAFWPKEEEKVKRTRRTKEQMAEAS